MSGDWRETLWTLLVTFCIVIIRCTETFWSSCIMYEPKLFVQSPSGISSHTTFLKFSAFCRALDFFVVFKIIYQWIQCWATWIHFASSHHFSCKSHLVLSSPFCLWLTSSFFLVRFLSQAFWRIVDLPYFVYLVSVVSENGGKEDVAILL